MVATVVALTTVAAAAATLGDFTVAAAAVSREDAAGSRRREAVVAPGVAGGAVGACAFILAGWCWGQLGGGKAVVAGNKRVERGSVFHGNMPKKYFTVRTVALWKNQMWLSRG